MTTPTLHEFLRELDSSNTRYSLQAPEDGAVVVWVSLLGERWEVEFFEDRNPEVEIFRSDGKVFALESAPTTSGSAEG